MNCNDFNNLVHELAEYKPMQAELRDAGLSHAAMCSQCAAKLATTRSVSNALVATAGMENEEAPAKIKANLLNAFAAIQQNESTTATVARIYPKRQWGTAVAAAVAAVILVALFVPIWRNRTSSVMSPIPDGPQSMAIKSGTVTAPSSEEKPVQVSGIQHRPGRTRSFGYRASVKARRATTTAPRLELENTVASNNSQFVPLTYLAKETAMDSGMIVRVELSRAALARFGLPVTDRDSGASVKAELVMGDDGVARAIRLIQ